MANTVFGGGIGGKTFDATYPPVSRIGNRRCVGNVSATGARCARWAMIGYIHCPMHIHKHRRDVEWTEDELSGEYRTNGKMRLRDLPVALFKSPTLNKILESNKGNLDARTGDTPLAIINTCLQALAAKIPAIDKLEDLSSEAISAMTMMSREVVDCLEVVARVDKMTERLVHVDQIGLIAEQFARLAARYVPEELHEDFAVELDGIFIPVITPKGQGGRAHSQEAAAEAAWEKYDKKEQGTTGGADKDAAEQIKEAEEDEANGKARWTGKPKEFVSDNPRNGKVIAALGAAQSAIDHYATDDEENKSSADSGGLETNWKPPTLPVPRRSSLVERHPSSVMPAMLRKEPTPSPNPPD